MDIITHVTNLDKFRFAAAMKVASGSHDFSIAGDAVFILVDKIPVVYSGNESIGLVRVENMVDCNYLKRLGEHVGGRYVFDSEDCKNTYERILGDLTIEYTDENGITQTYNKPYMIGGFA
jgi:hypothetical protein